jgi:hypothetical protein
MIGLVLSSTKRYTRSTVFTDLDRGLKNGCHKQVRHCGLGEATADVVHLVLTARWLSGDTSARHHKRLTS